MRWVLPLAVLLVGIAAQSDANTFIPGTVNQGAPGLIPWPTVPFQQTGAGSLSVSASAQINTMTQTYGSALPTAWTNLIVIDNGTGDIAVCPQGGTCTCASGGVAATNGTTIKAGGGSNQFNWNSIAQAAPSIVSCNGSAQLVDFEF